MPDLGVELIVPGEDETARWQLGEMIRKLRELRGLTQKALADKIFISQPLLPKYENANRTIPRTTFTVILAALEATDAERGVLEKQYSLLSTSPESYRYIQSLGFDCK